jgi:hypothetical protein
MEWERAAPIDYCRAIVPLIGVGLGIYLIVIHSDRFWMEVIGYPNMALAAILLVLSLLVLGLGLLPLFVSTEGRQSSIRTAYIMTTVLSLFVILVISTRISVTAQCRADFWFASWQPLSNESRLAEEFLSVYDTEGRQKAFIREQTATPHIITCSLSYFWIAVLGFAERCHLFERLASRHYRDSGDTEKAKEESSAEEDGIEAEIESAASSVEEVPVANADDGKASSRHGASAESEQPATRTGGRDSDYSDSEVVVRIEFPMRSAPPKLEGEVPAALRSMNFDPPPAPSSPAARRRRGENWRYPLDDGVLSLSDSGPSYDFYYSDYSDWF